MTTSLQAQVLSGKWVDQQNQRIEASRQGSLRVIVLDAQGKAVPGARVQVTQLRHDFHFGLRLDSAWFKENKPLVLSQGTQQILKLISAVTIETPAIWNILEPEQGKADWAVVDRMLAWAGDHDMNVRWGQVVSQDQSDLPGWVVKSSDEALAKAVEDHIITLDRKLAGRVQTWDVLTDLSDHDYLTRRIGPSINRRLLSHALMQRPAAGRAVRFTDALGGDRLTHMVKAVTALRDEQAPISSVALDVKLGGNVAYVSVQRSLDWLAKIGLPIDVMNLEVGGPSPGSAAINLETVLRTCFAQPGVQGIWLDGLSPDQVLDPSSALIDAKGNLTPAGQLFVNLVGKMWWTDQTVQADNLGNIRLRVFAGAYRIDASWFDGQATATTYVEPDKQTRVVIVQPLTAVTAVTPNL